jgi:hypothetical protein
LCILFSEADRVWWPLRSSKPWAGSYAVGGGFDSHPFRFFYEFSFGGGDFVTEDDFLSIRNAGRKLKVEAEKEKKYGDLKLAGEKIYKAAVNYLKAYCAEEQIPIDDESMHFKATAEIARRVRQQTFNKQFGLAYLMHLHWENRFLSGDQIKSYFQDVQKFIRFCDERLKLPRNGGE